MANVIWVTGVRLRLGQDHRVKEIVVTPTWRERVEELAGKRRDVWLVAALIVVLALGALVLRARSAQPAIAPPAEAAATAWPAAVVSPTVVMPSVAPGTMILVHVAGAVRRPGLYEIAGDARIADAIDLAKGPKPIADLSALNLAEPLTDGQKIDVPRRGEDVPATAPLAPVPGSTTSPVPGGSININTADQIALETIPGIGPVTAQAIIAYRTEVGSFSSIEQLLEVSGIGPATLESMRPYVTL